MIVWAIATVAIAIASVTVHATGLQQTPADAVASSGMCGGWAPRPAQRTVTVSTVDQLHAAVDGATPGTTIVVQAGDYVLQRTIELRRPDVVLRGATGNPADVVFRGAGMTEQRVGVAVGIGASQITVADLTIRDVGFHGIQVRGEAGASDGTIRNVRVVDTGQQLVKGSTAGGPQYSDRMTVACSTFEYTDSAPSDYTNGIDVLGGRDWVIRDNVLRRIHGPASQGFGSGPAILFWANSIGTVVERNVVVDSFRGIAFGLGPPTSLARDGQRRYDHQGGMIRNNVVINLNSWADEGIEANAAVTAAIDHNTIVTTGNLPWAISARFGATAIWVRNNLTSKPVLERDGGRASLAGNVSGAAPDWFVNLAAGNAALSGGSRQPVDAGISIEGLTADFTGQPRIAGSAPDAGAVEFITR